MGNDEMVHGRGECKGLCTRVQGIDICDDFLALELGNSDVILGIQWLEKLGPVTTNWKLQTMRFKCAREEKVLQGDPALERTQISLKAIFRTLQKEKGGVVLELNQIEKNVIEDTTEPEEVLHFLLTNLQKYDKVFHMPNGLPPSRDKEHAIVLKSGSNPVSVRPYHYPQIQKDEIEKLVKEMLAAQIIQPPTSPFSILVLLVKKKDGS